MSCSCRCAYGFLSAFRRSFTATIADVRRGRRSGGCRRGCAARSSRPRPRRAALERRHRSDSAHIAFALGLLLEGDGEHALVDAGLRRVAATIAVEPPTEPAVCTRSIGLPTAPSASARYSSGIITPSKKSGALPMTTASMSAHVDCRRRRGRGRPPRARGRPSRRLPLGAVLRLADADDGAVAWSSVALQDAHEVLLQAGAAAWRGPRPRGLAAWIRPAASPMRMSPAAIIGLAASAPPDGFIRDVVAEPERLAQDQLLVREGRVQLGDVDAVRRRRPVPRRARSTASA